MPLDFTKPCFINQRDVVLRTQPLEKTRGNAENHLLLGDYATGLGKTKGVWVKVNCRNCQGWLKKEWLTNERLLEVNFVDIGQGDGCHIVTPNDEVILIDAGEGVGISGKGGDNMARFINWRYNLRNRKVVGVDGVKSTTAKAKDPLEIDYTIITHPDLDHYYGFLNIFKNRKLSFKNVCHNGVVERPLNGADKKTWFADLGMKVPPNAKSNFHLWSTVTTNREMHDLIQQNTKTRKMYISTLREVIKNSAKVKFLFLDASKKFLGHFDKSNELQIQVLAPIAEDISFDGKKRQCLLRLGNEGVTKNGHSIVLKLKFGKLNILLGGDLNSKSQDYIARYYSNINNDMSRLEKDIRFLRENSYKTTLKPEERKKNQEKLEDATKLLDLIITRTRNYFESDIAKACHHGSSDVLDSFYRAINPIATVISSGDNESHSHPRPDALGSFGKAGRGSRPLIFSTELARSTNEFSSPIKHFLILKKLDEERKSAISAKEKADITEKMENLRDRNVAKYGMITVRTDGEQVIIAQKLEEERGPDKKWDIYDLTWNKHLGEFVYL